MYEAEILVPCDLFLAGHLVDVLKLLNKKGKKAKYYSLSLTLIATI